MYKIDLHTHSIDSPDGGLKLEDYVRALQDKTLNYIAITDHNSITYALQVHEKLGDYIIVGEEIMTSQGEIIGLFLNEPVATNLSPEDTVKEIKKQQGIVYIPHPFETVRSGISKDVLSAIIDDVDIIETHNGRAIFQNCSSSAQKMAVKYQKSTAASSDAHGKLGWGRTYTMIEAVPDRTTLVDALTLSSAKTQTVGVRGLMYPKYNRLRKRFSHVK